MFAMTKHMHPSKLEAEEVAVEGTSEPLAADFSSRNPQKGWRHEKDGNTVQPHVYCFGELEGREMTDRTGGRGAGQGYLKSKSLCSWWPHHSASEAAWCGGAEHLRGV